MVNNINDELVDLRNTIIKKEIPENKNPNKIVDIVEKIIDFNEQQKGRQRPLMLVLRPLDLACVALVAKVFDRTPLKMRTHKQMLQRLPIALAQVKAGNTSENLLNEIMQIIYSLYRAKEITKKIFNNIMNSIKL